jgi:Family of unknown function (DUF6065)
MKLKAVSLCEHLEPRSTIRKANPKRAWIEHAGGGAYRCLPLVMANQLGWELCLPVDVEATWNGGTGLDGIEIATGAESANSHFGHGILTFPVWTLFRTPRGINLMVTGPVNQAKANIVALEGIVETDWAPMTFTMNWQFTAVGVPVFFQAGEAFARVFPIPRGFAEGFTLEEMSYREMPIDEQAHYEDWRSRRGQWLVEHRDPREWMKDYVKGAYQRPGSKCPFTNAIKEDYIPGERLSDASDRSPSERPDPSL